MRGKGSTEVWLIRREGGNLERSIGSMLETGDSAGTTVLVVSVCVRVCVCVAAQRHVFTMFTRVASLVTRRAAACLRFSHPRTPRSGVSSLLTRRTVGCLRFRRAGLGEGSFFFGFLFF